jgi:hypothetical protein
VRGRASEGRKERGGIEGDGESRRRLGELERRKEADESRIRGSTYWQLTSSRTERYRTGTRGHESL